MKVSCDGRREARELFPKAKHSGVIAVALIALLVGVHAKASNAADTLRAPVLKAKSDAFAFPETGPKRVALRYSPDTGTKIGISFSDQIMMGATDRLSGASLHVAAGKLSSWTLSPGANDADKCSDEDGSARCMNRRRVLSDGMDVVVSTANTSGSSDLPGYMVVAAATQSAGLLESDSAVRNTVTPGHKDGGRVPVNNALSSAVPEPLNYAMMLAGLGLMGFVATRRQM